MNIYKVANAFSVEIRNCSWMQVSVTGFMSCCIIVLENCIHWSFCNVILLLILNLFFHLQFLRYFLHVWLIMFYIALLIR
jgi:hypothetical protein